MRRACCWLGLLLAGALAHAQLEATVTLSGPGRALSALGGVNVGLSMNLLDTRDMVAELGLTAVRFPPGNAADDRLLEPAAVAAFAAQWRLLGEPPVLVVLNLFSGTPEQAAASARLLLDAGVAVLAWEIGNEPDLYGPARGEPSWTPAAYCARFRAYRRALEALEPAIPLAGPAVSGAAEAEGYLREVLRLCGDAIDILSWHLYPTDGSASDEAALASATQVGESIRRYRAWLRDPEVNPLGHGREIRLAITEYGLSWRSQTRRHLADQVAALWLADALGQMAAEGLELSFYFALQGLGGHGLIGDDLWPRPTYDVFALLADFGGAVLEADSSLPDLHAYAAQDGETLRVLLVNLSLEPLRVRLPGLVGAATVHTLFAEGTDPLRDERPHDVRAQPASAPVTLPGRALALLELPAGEPR